MYELLNQSLVYQHISQQNWHQDDENCPQNVGNFPVENFFSFFTLTSWVMTKDGIKFKISSSHAHELEQRESRGGKWRTLYKACKTIIS